MLTVKRSATISFMDFLHCLSTHSRRNRDGMTIRTTPSLFLGMALPPCHPHLFFGQGLLPQRRLSSEARQSFGLPPWRASSSSYPGGQSWILDGPTQAPIMATEATTKITMIISLVAFITSSLNAKERSTRLRIPRDYISFP